MSAFEYVSVLSSIVIGLGLADVLQSLHRLFRNHRLVRWDWAAPVATLYAVLTIIFIWWGIFRPEARDVSIGAFLPQLVELVLLFLLASAALPDEVPSGGLDLKAYYDRNGPYFWTLFTAAMGWLILFDLAESVLNGEGLAVVGDRLVDFVVLGVFVSLIFVRNRWWHAAAFLLISIGPIGWMTRTLTG